MTLSILTPELGRSGGRQVAIVTGSHLNSYAILLALREMNWSQDIVFIKDKGENPAYEDLVPDITTWRVALNEPSDLLSVLEERCNNYSKAFLFLTDERFHRVLSENRGLPAIQNVIYHLGSCRHLDAMLDRTSLYHLLSSNRLCGNPLTIEGCEDPWERFRGPFLLRFKQSWDGLRKLDRVRLVRTEAELKALVCGFRERGIDSSGWCYQELLSTDPRDNVSVSGWHSEEARAYCVTRTLCRYPPIRGSALVCEVVDGLGVEALREITQSILSEVQYSGPFELEFVRDPRDGAFKVIELNPRFWLQHSLVQHYTEFALIRHYLGLSVDELMLRTPSRSRRRRYWINTTHVLAGLLRGRIGLARFLWCEDTIRMPSLPMALRFVFRYITKKTGS